MQNLTCIVCPIGCALEIKENDLSVTGNKCPKGETYAIEELTAPKRTVTATCKIENNTSSTLINSVPRTEGSTCLCVNLIPRLPVKTSLPCPKELIPDLLNDIYKLKVSLPVKLGDVIIENWNGEGFNVIATRSIG